MLRDNMPKPIHNRKLKLALVGLGRVAKTHLDAIKYHQKNLELVAVCDSNQDALAKVKAEFKADTFTEFNECIANTDADVVILCTPSGLHAKQTIAVANAGKHVITEKPMATKWQDGLAMMDACDDNGVALFVVKQNRFNGPVSLLKQAILAGRFGKINLVTANVFWHRQQAYYDQGSWRGTWALDGGAFMNQASHYFDLLNWLVGPVKTVFAITDTLGRQVETEDTGVLALKWRHGAIGSLNVTVLTYPKDKEGSITILGEHGSAKIGGVALNQITEWDFAKEHAMDEQLESVGYTTDSVYGFGHRQYYQNIVDVFQGKDKPMSTGVDGLQALELLVASYMSARDGMAVHLPLEL